MEILINNTNPIVHYDGSLYEENITIDNNLMNNEILNDCIIKLSNIKFNIIQFDRNRLTRKDFIDLQNLETSLIVSQLIRLQNINFQTRIRLNESIPRNKYVTIV